MGTATVRWIGGKQFVGIDSTQHAVVLSTPAEGVGMKPSELLLVALASCTAVDVVDILEKKRQPISSWKSAPAETRRDPPWLTARSTCTMPVWPGTDRKSVSQASSFRKRSTVRLGPLKGVATITTDFTLLSERNRRPLGLT
jgi:putative redox protein